MPKYYFDHIEAEYCFTLDYHVDRLKEDADWHPQYDHELGGLILYRATQESDQDYHYCRHYGQMGEKGYCGTSCDHYTPRNGVNGNCSHNRQLRSPGQAYLLRINPTRRGYTITTLDDYTPTQTQTQTQTPTQTPNPNPNSKLKH